jgi:2-hydroxychromene-2-carboxylate isomerase
MPSPAPSGATCRDIAEDDEIRACLVAAGFDPGSRAGLLAGAEEYTRNLEDAVSAGVFGAPFYIVDGVEKFWGQDRIEDLDAPCRGAL